LPAADRIMPIYRMRRPSKSNSILLPIKYSFRDLLKNVRLGSGRLPKQRSSAALLDRAYDGSVTKHSLYHVYLCRLVNLIRYQGDTCNRLNRAATSPTFGKSSLSPVAHKSKSSPSTCRRNSCLSLTQVRT